MPPPSVATAAPLPGGRLTALSCLPLEQWLAALGLPAALLPLLDDLGAEQTEDLAHLEAMDVEELCGAAGLKLVQRRKLSKAVRAVRVACGWDNDSGGNGDDAGTKAAPLALAATAPEAGTAVARRRPAPTVARVSSEEVQRHARVLRNYAATAAVDEGTAREAPSDDDVIRSLHVAWAACVAEPFLRRQLLPSLFAIARRPSAGAPEREAALALVFLSFSLSGAAIKVAEPAGSRASGAGPDCVVMIFGWLGSTNDEFDSLSSHYRQTYPSCRVLTTVAGGDRWAQASSSAPPAPSAGEGAAADAQLPPPRFADGSPAEWPTAALCEEQLWRLAEAMLPPATHAGDVAQRGPEAAAAAAAAAAPRVFFHLFSNGFTLYVRLLMHLQQRAAEGEAACAEALRSIKGVVLDSTPAWGPGTAIPPPPIVKLVALQAVAAVLKKEAVPGLTMRDIVSTDSPIKSAVHAACERAQTAVFDSTWHYDWALQHEPPAPALFVFSKVDRTTRQEAIEGWLHGNRQRWQQLGRSVRTLLLPHTSHCMHWFKARAQYTTALAELADAWYQHE